MNPLEKNLLLRYGRCLATTSRLARTHASPAHSVKRKPKNSRSSDTFGLIGSLGRGVSLFKPEENDSVWKGVDDVRGTYEKKTRGLLAFEIKEQKKIPVISEPLYWTKAAKKKATKRELDKQRYMEDFGIDPENARVLIGCARKEFTHYEGMKYPTEKIPLVSQYWAKSKYKGDWFTIEPLQNIPILETAKDYCWEQVMGIMEEDIVTNAINAGYLRPTMIQVNCFTAFLNEKHLFIAAETGSGKTLAYAVPLLSQLLKSKNSGKEEQALILVPTVELLAQTRQYIKNLVGDSDLKVLDEEVIAKNATQDDNLCGNKLKDWGIIISTPGTARKLLSKCDDKSSIRTIVMDEADMLLDDSFVDDLSDIFQMVELRYSSLRPAWSAGARLIFTSASCPDMLQTLVESLVDSGHLYYIKSPFLHNLLPHVRQKFIRIREIDKNDELLKMLTESKLRGQTLIFCQNKVRRNMVANFLNENGIKATVFGERNRREVFEKMAGDNTGIMIATDVAARGLDFPRLSLVINYDFPTHVVDYIHRVGRVGRLSSEFKSRVVSFVRRAAEVRVVNSIELAARFNRSVRGVETNVSAEFRKGLKS